MTATLISPAAPATPLPDAGDGVTTDAALDSLINGDPRAWPAAILWSLVAVAAWFGTWLLARRWKKLPAYAIGTPVVAVLLFFAFENIARLLPAGF